MTLDELRELDAKTASYPRCERTIIELQLQPYPSATAWDGRALDPQAT